jgi:aminoglycoside phosphotransferase (APT) family kinase protein
LPSQDNFFRGGALNVYNNEVIESLNKVKDQINCDLLLKIWNDSILNIYEEKGVFVHGDIASGNIIFFDKKLYGLIDLGTMSIGDPSCDLIIAYTVFYGESIMILKMKLNMIKTLGFALWVGHYGRLYCN